MDFARYAYAAGHVVALVAFIWSGLWRRFPAFTLALIPMAIVAATYAPESRAWINDVYLRAEPAAVILRLSAAMEVILLLTPAPYRIRLAVGLTLLSSAVLLSIVAIEPGSNLFAFVSLRRYLQIATAVWMLTGIGVLWSTSHLLPDVRGLHAVILAALITKQAVYSVMSFRGWGSARQWFSADWPGLLISSLCCLLWTGLAIAYSRAPRR